MAVSKLKTNYSLISTTVLAVLVFLVVNFASTQWLGNYRMDFTENRLYTLSERFVGALNDLSEPIDLTLYMTRSSLLELPELRSYAERVEDYLQEIKRHSAGRITLSVIDPKPFSEAEDIAVSHGIQGIPLRNGSKVYFGLLATNSVDGVQVIPHFFAEREELLEYDLIRLILALEGRPRKKVGVLSWLPIQGAPVGAGGATQAQDPWTFFTQMQSNFDVELLSTSTDVLPADIETLVLIHPRNVSDRLLDQIDQFVLRGNNLLLLVDPYSELLALYFSANPQLGQQSSGSNLNILTKKWGFTLNESKLVGDLPIAAQVVDAQASAGGTIDYPVWMNLQPKQFNQNDVVTAKLGNMTMATAGVIEIDSAATTQISALIWTSKTAMSYDLEEFSAIHNLSELVDDYQSENREYPLAVRISGMAQSSFSKEFSVNSDASEYASSSSKHLSEGAVDVIVVADTDFLHDRFWVREETVLGQRVAFAEASNGKFISNAVDNLSGDNKLIGVRTRGRTDRPFVVTHNLRQAAEQKYRRHVVYLRAELEKIEALLHDFSAIGTRSSGLQILTDEQIEQIKQARHNQLSIRRQLREVQHKLVKDIEQLKNHLTLLNLLVVPALIAFIGIVVCAIGSRHRERRLAKLVSSYLS